MIPKTCARFKLFLQNRISSYHLFYTWIFFQQTWKEHRVVYNILQRN